MKNKELKLKPLIRKYLRYIVPLPERLKVRNYEVHESTVLIQYIDGEYQLRFGFISRLTSDELDAISEEIKRLNND
jgi:hypothetical protein